MHLRLRPLTAIVAPVVVVASVAGLAAVTRAQGAPQSRARVAFERTLPRMDGSQLRYRVVEVTAPPGAASAPHQHGCAVVVYVVAGAMRMQVRGGPDSVYRAGETFFESPTDIHQVSANPSPTDTARFTATFVCDHDGPLTTPVAR